MRNAILKRLYSWAFPEWEHALFGVLLRICSIRDPVHCSSKKIMFSLQVFRIDFAALARTKPL